MWLLMSNLIFLHTSWVPKWEFSGEASHAAALLFWSLRLIRAQWAECLLCLPLNNSLEQWILLRHATVCVMLHTPLHPWILGDVRSNKYIGFKSKHSLSTCNSAGFLSHQITTCSFVSDKELTLGFFSNILFSEGIVKKRKKESEIKTFCRALFIKQFSIEVWLKMWHLLWFYDCF